MDTKRNINKSMECLDMNQIAISNKKVTRAFIGQPTGLMNRRRNHSSPCDIVYLTTPNRPTQPPTQRSAMRWILPLFNVYVPKAGERYGRSRHVKVCGVIVLILCTCSCFSSSLRLMISLAFSSAASWFLPFKRSLVKRWLIHHLMKYFLNKVTV